MIKTLPTKTCLLALAFLLSCALTPGCTSTQNAHPQASYTHEAHHSADAAAYELTLTSNVQWGPLNPARGDNSPRAGDLWGDRTAKGATGFLVKFKQGFASPPHIHNITYRGVVIQGQVHNDDPTAQTTWLPPGSYWTQPAGEPHITAANASLNMAYIEIQSGPYLVLETQKAFDNGQQAINIAPSNQVWLNANDIKWIKADPNAHPDHSPMVTILWRKDNHQTPDAARASLLKLPPGFQGQLVNQSPSIRTVVIQGQPQLQQPGTPNPTTLQAGSYFGSKAPSIHHLHNNTKEPVLLYVRTQGPFHITATSK